MLKLSDLEAKDKERAKRNHETYKMIYSKVTTLITTQHETGNSSLVYDVPAFVLGRPMFNHAHAVRYVRDKLLKGGFRVEQMGCTLHVSWKKKQKDQKDPKEKPKKTKKKEDTKASSSKKESKTWLDNTPKSASKPPGKAKPTKVEEPLEVRLKRLRASLHK